MLEYQEQIIKICSDLQKHGYGRCNIQFEDKGYKIKVLIEAGKSYVFFIEKPPKQFDDKIIL